MCGDTLQDNMGETEVIKFLQKQKEALTGGEIARRMNESPPKTSRILTKLADRNEIEFKELDRHEARLRCGAFRRTRLYYIR